MEGTDHRQDDKTVDSLIWQSHQIQHRCLCGNAGCCLGGFLPLPVLSTNIAPVASSLGASSTGHFPISEPSPPHSHTIHPDIVPPLKKVFERLLHPTLMESCVLGATQNLNESFNSTIWQHCPKSEFCSATTVEIVVNLVVISFNSGQVPFAKFQERLEVTVSPPTRQYLSDKDHHRVSASVMKAEAQVKRRWQAQHLDRVALAEQQVAEQQVAEEGETYGSGRFSHHRTGRTQLRS